MTLPANAYRDPADIIEQIDTQLVRQVAGCGACRFRGGKVLGRRICRIGNNPGNRGHCRRWELDEGWSDGS